MSDRDSLPDRNSLAVCESLCVCTRMLSRCHFAEVVSPGRRGVSRGLFDI
jgi:hypothetical protein